MRRKRAGARRVRATACAQGRDHPRRIRSDRTGPARSRSRRHGVARARLPHARAPACRERPAWLLSRGKPRAVRRGRDRATVRVDQCVDCRGAGDASRHLAWWCHGGRDCRERHRRRARVPSRSARGHRPISVRRARQRVGRPVGAAGGLARGRDAGGHATRDRRDSRRGRATLECIFASPEVCGRFSRATGFSWRRSCDT